MTRVQRLSLWALAGTLLQVAWGAFTRGSGSGYGCADRWPLCEGGLIRIGDAGGLLPRPELHMVVEWLHRWIALVVGIVLVWLAVEVWRRHRGTRRLVVPALAAVVVIVAQSLLGAAVVVTDLRADLVVVHLLGATALLGVLAYAATNSFLLPGSAGGRRAGVTAEGSWTTGLAAAAAATLVTMVLGATVHNQYVAGWPLVGGRWLPDLLGSSRLVTLHFGHRLAAGLTLPGLVWLAWRAVRGGRPPVEVRLVHATLALFAVNVGLGAVHVVTEVSSVVAIVAHLGVGAGAWTTAVAAWTAARRHDELARGAGPGPVDSSPVRTAGVPA